MRRKDLMLSRQEAMGIIDANEYAVLALTGTDGRPYAFPMDYFRNGDTLFFHGAKEGRKVDAMKANPWACAVITGETAVVPDKFGRRYRSVIAEGPIELVDEPGAKREVMQRLVESRSPGYREKGQMVIERMLDRVLVYKMSLANVTGKHGL